MDAVNETEDGFFNKLTGDEVVVPDLSKLDKYLLIEVVDESDEGTNLRLTTAGMGGDMIADVITNLFFSINGQ